MDVASSDYKRVRLKAEENTIQEPGRRQPIDVLKVGTSQAEPVADNQTHIAIASALVEDGIEALDTVARLIKRNTAAADPVDSKQRKRQK